MVAIFNIKDITLNSVKRSSGHEAYLSAIYNPPDKQSLPHKVIVKKNKYGCPDFSRMEVKFSQLARLFLSAGLTPNHNLVVDDTNKVFGLAIQHLCYVIAKKEGDKGEFYTLVEPYTDCTCDQLMINTPEQLPIYFLDKLPQGFFSSLVAAKAQGKISIDYESLASLLATSYTLEEDDLHKGNFGFYLVARDGKPHAVFFKIDHDLMFVNSVMGFYTRRPFHLLQGVHAFDITKDDLLSLVCLKDSSNSYWPTKFGYIANPFDNKEYHNYDDIKAFAQLSANPEFNRAKWKSFYKHILIPNELIAETLKECSNMKDAQDRAEVAMLLQALRARLAHLRAVLFSIPDFRDYVATLNDEETIELLAETLPQGQANERFRQQVYESMAKYKNLCTAPHGFEPGDTPLHTAIKLGEYRYQETMRMFGQFINVENDKHQTPLDSALQKVNMGHEEQDPQSNAYLIMRHLLEKGALKTTLFKKSGLGAKVSTYIFQNPYLDSINKHMHYRDFRTILRDIGEDHRFGLKFKKNVALECIRRFITVNQHHPHAHNRLAQLHDDINGLSATSACAGVKYIRQLRSKLWIVRQLRGMYGLTSTQWKINGLISEARKLLQTQDSGCFSFFSKTHKRYASDLVAMESKNCDLMFR